jgi:hypothetical protein
MTEKVSWATERLICRLYLAGEKGDYISSVTGHSQATVVHVVRRCGYPVRGAGRPRIAALAVRGGAENDAGASKSEAAPRVRRPGAYAAIG